MEDCRNCEKALDIALLKSHMERTDKQLEKIDKKLDDLVSFKFQILGGVIVISALMTYFGKYLIQ